MILEQEHLYHLQGKHYLPRCLSNPHTESTLKSRQGKKLGWLAQVVVCPSQGQGEAMGTMGRGEETSKLAD